MKLVTIDCEIFVIESFLDNSQFTLNFKVTAQTRAIDGMRETRDEKLAAIQNLNAKLMDAKRQLAATPGNLPIKLAPCVIQSIRLSSNLTCVT